MPRDPSTGLIHHPYRPPAGFEAPQPGIHKASTVIFANVAAMRARDWRSKQGYTYGLHGTPTTFTLEERIATLEGGTQCVLAPSGLAAIALVGQALHHRQARRQVLRPVVDAGEDVQVQVDEPGLGHGISGENMEPRLRNARPRA